MIANWIGRKIEKRGVAIDRQVYSVHGIVYVIRVNGKWRFV